MNVKDEEQKQRAAIYFRTASYDRGYAAVASSRIT